MKEHLFLLILVFVALLIVVGLAAALFSGRTAIEHPYDAVDALLSPAERSFFGVLQQALGSEFVPFAKVRLADILRIQRGLSGARRTAAFNRIKAKHADFVLCDPRTFRIIGIIELDDKSHREEARQRRDQFIDAALAAAGISVLHVLAQRSYSIPELRSQLLAAFSAEPVAPSNRNA